MTDYIDREALVKSMKDRYCAKTKCNNYHGVRCLACYIADAIADIEDAPVADVAPIVRGHWLTWEEKFPGRATGKNLGVFCSVCENHADYSSDFCPNCGAKMEEKS